MTIKPFAIQGADLTLGGVNLQAGTTGVVIPGVTQATNYTVEEVNDRENQTRTFQSAPIVIDYVTYTDYDNNGQTTGLRAEYAVEALDDAGYIDGIRIQDSSGSYTSGEAAILELNDMWAYIGSAQDPYASFVGSDWVQIPFRPKVRAGSIETIGGGASLGNLSVDGYTLVDRDETDNFLSLAQGNDHIRLATSHEKSIYLTTNHGRDAPYGVPQEVSKTWEFDKDGSLKFPDGTSQTTAYTGSGGGASSPIYIMANADGNVTTSTDGVTWGTPVASGVPDGGGPTTVIGKLDVNDGVIVYTRADTGVDTGVQQTGLYYSTTIGTASLCAGTNTFDGDDCYWNEVHYFATPNKWVAVGYASGGPVTYPIVAHSTDGISWTVVSMDNAFLSTYTGGNSINGQFTDVVYSTVTSQYVISAVRDGSGNFGGMFVTSDITVALGSSNFVDIDTNIWRLGYWPYAFYGAEGIIFAVNNGATNFELWSGVANFGPSGLLAAGSWQYGTGWYEDTMTTNLGYIPNVSEVAYNDSVFIVTTEDGQVFVQGNAPFSSVTIPLPYTNTDFTITNANPAVITFNGPRAPKHNEKIVITGAGDFNGTFYVSVPSGVLYTNQGLTSSVDSSGFAAFATGGTVTLSHGQFLDSAGAAGQTLFVGSDDEQVFRSTDLGATWTMEADVTGRYFNDFAYGTFYGGGGGNQLANGDYRLKLNTDGTITFPDGSEQASASGQLPQWLKVVHHTQHLPYYGVDFGWDINGLWTTNATIHINDPEGTSYPFRTNFTIPHNKKTIVTVDFLQGNGGETDFGLAVFQDNVNPVWSWNNIEGGGNRIGAQFNGPQPQIYGITTGASSSGNIGSGWWTVKFTVDPTGGVYNVVTMQIIGSDGSIFDTLTVNDQLFTGPYRVGFASDNDNGDEKGYFKNLTINVDNGTTVYYDTLQGDNSLILGTLKNVGWNFNYDLTAPTLKLSGPTGTEQVVITGPTPTSDSPNAQRLIIQGQRGYGRWGQSAVGEGGDIYLWAGVGGESNSSGGSGGDIKLRGGQAYNAEGGYIKLEAGFADNTTSGSGNTNHGNGGYIQINAADANGVGGGGYVQIKAGVATGSGTNGSITLQTSGSHVWTFGNDGNLILPSGTTIKNVSGEDLLAGSGASVGDFVIANTTLSAAAGTVAQSSYGISGLAWNSGDNTYVVTYSSAIGYGYHTKVKFASTGVSQLDNYTFYLNPYNNSTTQYGIYSDYDCTIKVDGSAFDSWTSNAGVTTELSPGAKITIKTGTPADGSGTDPGAIEFKIGGKSYGWTIDKDNHLQLPKDGGASKIKNYYGHNALFSNEEISVTAITNNTSDVIIKTMNPSGGPGAGVENWDGGGGWNQGYYSSIATTGGTGTGLRVNVAAGGGGYININLITIANPGSGYTNGDIITITNENNISGTFRLIVGQFWKFGADGRTTIPYGVNGPSTARGAAGDKAGMIIVSGAYLFHCYADYTDGSVPIWQKVAMDNTDWD